MKISSNNKLPLRYNLELDRLDMEKFLQDLENLDPNRINLETTNIIELIRIHLTRTR